MLYNCLHLNIHFFVCFAFFSGKCREGRGKGRAEQSTDSIKDQQEFFKQLHLAKEATVATVCSHSAQIRPGNHALLGLSSLRWASEQVSFINHESSNAALVNTEQTQLMYHGVIVLSWSHGAFTRSHF